MVRSAKWAKANPEKLRIAVVKWQKKNPEKVKGYKVKSQKAHLKRHAETNATWQKTHPEEFKACRCRNHAKDRTLGFNVLNSSFPGCEPHHINSNDVIFIPKALHRSVYHRQRDGRGMAQMNAVAFNFLFKQEVESAIAAKEQP